MKPFVGLDVSLEKTAIVARDWRGRGTDLSFRFRLSHPVHIIEKGWAVGWSDALAKPIGRTRHLGRDHEGR